MEKNKKIIEELSKNKTYSNKEETNYIKNILPKSPSYIDLDYEKQIEELKFKKKIKEESKNYYTYYTPQVNKIQYESAIRSSPHISTASSDKDSPTIKKGKTTAEFTLKIKSRLDEFQQGKKLG